MLEKNEILALRRRIRCFAQAQLLPHRESRQLTEGISFKIEQAPGKGLGQGQLPLLSPLLPPARLLPLVLFSSLRGKGGKRDTA